MLGKPVWKCGGTIVFACRALLLRAGPEQTDIHDQIPLLRHADRIQAGSLNTFQPGRFLCVRLFSVIVCSGMAVAGRLVQQFVAVGDS